MMNKEHVSGPIFVEYLRKAAADVGARLECLDEEFGYLVRLHRNGQFINICGESLPLNSVSASRIVRDKWYTLKILHRAGIPVPEGEIFFRGGYYRSKDYSRVRGKKHTAGYAAKLGYPVVVKPNSMSHGREVRLVRNADELEKAIDSVFNLDHIVMIQRPVCGDDIRAVLLEGALLLAYRRKTIEVLGDGRATVKELIAYGYETVPEERRSHIEHQYDDIASELAAQGLDLATVPEKGQRVMARSFNLNLATGTEAEDITEAIGPHLLGLCRKICEELNLYYAGIDLICRGPDLSDPVVLEVNNSPSLKNWYLSGHRDRVVEIYRILIDRMFQFHDGQSSVRRWK